jgi:hypothetical protein
MCGFRDDLVVAPAAAVAVTKSKSQEIDEYDYSASYDGGVLIYMRYV